MNPEISIVVPVYNVEEYLNKCLTSILTQTFRNFELILVNDGSSDRSGRICDDYVRSDNRVIVIHKENGGLSSARNTGIKIAKGEYLAFVDGDDYIDKNMYEVLYKLSKKTNSDISICKFGREINGELLHDAHTNFIKEMDHIEGMRQLFKGVLFRFSVCNKLFKRLCFDNINFPEGRIHEDLATTYKVFANSTKSVYTNYCGYIYVKRENSILTSKFNEKRLDAFIGWDEILSFMMQQYPQLSNEYLSCFAYGSIDNVLYILNQVDSREKQIKYLNVIRKIVGKYYVKILMNTGISIKYKFSISLLKYSKSLLLLTNGLKKSKIIKS